MASISKVIKDLFKPDVIKFGIRTRSISQWVQAGLREQNITLLDMNNSILMEYRGYKFKVDAITVHPVISVYDDYRLDRIRKGDVVLDIGAQIGAFAIPASNKAKIVHAVEPLFYDTLKYNRYLNGIENIEIHTFGINKRGFIGEAEYWGVKGNCDYMSFKKLKQYIGQVDFLKIDCEGAEWTINPDDLKGIRTIEAELHTFNLFHLRNVHKWERWLKLNGYEYDLIKEDSTRYMLHAELK